VAKTSRILETDKKGKTKDKGWTCELIPKSFIVARYFAREQAAIDAAQVDSTPPPRAWPSWRRNTAARKTS
jgi:type I restriction enzyme M protein